MNAAEIAVFERLIEAPDPAIEASRARRIFARRRRPRRTDRPRQAFPRPRPGRLTDDDPSSHVISPKLSILAGRSPARGRSAPSPAACPKGSMRCCSASSPAAALRAARRSCMSRATATGSPRWKRRLHFFAPDVEVLSFPAWDGVPYDRVAPNAETIARRIATLAALTDRAPTTKTPLIVLTTVNAAAAARAAARLHRRRRASSFSPATS